MAKYKNIMKDEFGGYHKQVSKMKIMIRLQFQKPENGGMYFEHEKVI